MSLLAAIHEPRLRIAEVLERRGSRLPIEPWDACAAALATRRCVFCAAKAQCDAWLACGAREGFERFCPNAGFIEERSPAHGG
jgi:hypothetical protein